MHADHVTGSGALKTQLKPDVVQSIISKVSGAKADIYVGPNDIIECGQSVQLRVLATPGKVTYNYSELKLLTIFLFSLSSTLAIMLGHTNGCVSYYCPDGPYVFTGDCLLIMGCGRTDFQQGDSGQLYNSIHQELFTLPEDCFVYPAHDYSGILS